LNSNIISSEFVDLPRASDTRENLASLCTSSSDRKTPEAGVDIRQRAENSQTELSSPCSAKMWRNIDDSVAVHTAELNFPGFDFPLGFREIMNQNVKIGEQKVAIHPSFSSRTLFSTLARYLDTHLHRPSPSAQHVRLSATPPF
jgi:hypothetical protein